MPTRSRKRVIQYLLGVLGQGAAAGGAGIDVDEGVDGVVDVLGEAEADREREEDHVELLKPAGDLLEGFLGV